MVTKSSKKIPDPVYGGSTHLDHYYPVTSYFSVPFAYPVAMDARGNILEWDEHDVHLWLSKLGYPHYEAQIQGKWFVCSHCAF